MEKIYIIIEDSTFEYDQEINVYAFKNEKKAKEKLQELKYSNFLKEVDIDDYIIEEDNEFRFCAFIEGRYVEDHYNISIEEKVLGDDE